MVMVSGQSVEVWGAQMRVGSSAGTYVATSNTTTNSGGGSYVLAPNGLNETYSYDSFGNMQQAGNFTFQQPYTPENRLFGYAYDAAGNLLTDRLTLNMTYDANERIASVNNTTYSYLPTGERVGKSGGSGPATDTIYFGGRPIARLSGGVYTDLIYGPNGLLAEVPTGGVPTYRMLDHLGTEVGTIDNTGNVLSVSDYAPFGQQFSGGDGDPYKFTGKERDAESGLDYFGARYYGSSMGRFMSPDPLGWLDWQHGNEEDQKKFEGFISDPQHFNQYAYVLNNPLKFTDPDGLLEYIAKLLGKDINVHIDDNLTDKQQNSLKGRLDAAIKNVNDHAGSLTGDQKSVLGNIKSIDVDGSLKRSFVNESGGDFHLTTDYVKQGSTAWLGSAIGHDRFHVQEFKMGGIGASRGTNAEKGAFQFQLGLGQKIGFTSTETNYLKNLIAHPESLSGYYNSPVK